MDQIAGWYSCRAAWLLFLNERETAASRNNDSIAHVSLIEKLASFHRPGALLNLLF